eukprot:TRINITY_DN23938_c0_g1_i1.p2 TRINITY_DN23938_c0_g1~~TRINITY_DN23938_c0_g1_i1.p2  ORF type:complete len:59 (-),score=0.55 TRINITY_DN23938_c0_g1_i1:49-225(-)
MNNSWGTSPTSSHKTSERACDKTSLSNILARRSSAWKEACAIHSQYLSESETLSFDRE